MRTALGSLVVLALSGCTSDQACRSLALGTRIETLERTQLTEASDPVWRALRSPQSVASSASSPSLVGSVGPAEEAMCCSTEAGKPLAWCAPEQLECTAPAHPLRAAPAVV
jgi:hypothetical protein